MLGTSLLSATVKRAGFSSRVLDFNAQFARDYPRVFPSKSWEELEPLFVDFNVFQRHRSELNSFVEDWCDQILRASPKLVGISIFTQRNRFFARELCARLRQLAPETKILIGGADCIGCHESFRAEGLIDFYILGEADEAIVQLLKGNLCFPGINSRARPIANLSEIPIPDYSDLDLSLYVTRPPAFFVSSSRGCPYSCTFCDVRSIWASFRKRDPIRVVEEVKFYVTEYGSRKFNFTDSLLNADMTHFRELLLGLTRIREECGGDIGWDGFCVISPKGKMTAGDFHLLRSAGCERIKIGVESGSPSVRRHMRKPYEQEDLDYFLLQASLAGVGVDLLLMVGYPTESRDDFKLTKKMLRRYSKYADEGTIQFVRIDMTHVTTAQPMFELRDQLKMELNGPSGQWQVPGLDFTERLRRYFELREFAMGLGYRIMAEQDQERQAMYRRLFK